MCVCANVFSVCFGCVFRKNALFRAQREEIVFSVFSVFSVYFQCIFSVFSVFRFFGFSVFRIFGFSGNLGGVLRGGTRG